jgi:tetratricopeptide (TPR) repeat protein
MIQALISIPAYAQPALQPTLQEQFNSATDAWERNDCAAALPLFDKLAHDPRVKAGTLPAASIAVRRGDCLVRTGRLDEGEVLILTGLPALREAGKQFVLEVAQAETQLGMLAMSRWDHDAALRHLNAALDLRKGDDRETTLMHIAVLTSFDGGHQGLEAAAEGLKLAEIKAKPDKKTLAQWHTIRGRIMLNQGQTKEGRDELMLALDLAGGLTDHITLADAVIRADLAQASMLAHHTEDAYRYMAMSGAGRVEKSPFTSAAHMEAPACGPDTGLEPQDNAVVEFSIGDDGSVRSAQPVYANGNYAKATAFARAVAQWQWHAEDAAQIPLFFRVATRVELHCTRASGEGSASPLAPLRERFAAWAEPRLASYTSNAQGKLTGLQWLAIAEAAGKANDAAVELAARVYLAPQDLRGAAVARASVDQGLELANGQNKLPIGATNAARVLLLAARTEIDRSMQHHKIQQVEGPMLADVAMLALADDPRIAQDALGQDTALLLAVPTRPRALEADQTMATIRRVAADARLPEHHPIRQFAQLRLANDAARAGNLAEAQNLFATTGLSQEQCALIGPSPALTHVNDGASSFPWEALRWGFEGWVRTEFDIKADGHTAAIRSVIAYPPFIFGDAASGMMTSARYQSTFRPAGGTACSANTETIKFVIPGNQNTTKVVKRKS